jgi:hypothetical protein
VPLLHAHSDCRVRLQAEQWVWMRTVQGDLRRVRVELAAERECGYAAARDRAGANGAVQAGGSRQEQGAGDGRAKLHGPREERAALGGSPAEDVQQGGGKKKGTTLQR